MSEMVERIADVLARLPVRDASDPGGELDKLRRREAALAVLDALETPTDEMMEAGRWIADAFGVGEHECGDIYRAMLSQAKGTDK